MQGSGLLACLAFITRKDRKCKLWRSNQVQVIQGKVMKHRIGVRPYIRIWPRIKVYQKIRLHMWMW
jgi:hypothetical protein